MKTENSLEHPALAAAPATPASSKPARKRPPTRGSWKPGQSGNPGGRPKEVAHVKELARQHTELAIRTLVEIAARGQPDRARVAAAEALLDRAWGRPEQAVTVQGEVSEHRSFELTTRLVAEHPELLDVLFAAAARRELVAAGRRPAGVQEVGPAGRRERVMEAVEGAEAQG